MDTMKKILIWISILIGVFILSNFLINVGLNSTYKDIKRQDSNSQFVIYQADATYVNGRIRGLINNTADVDGNFLKIDLFSKRDVFVGRTYVNINKNVQTQPFELFFKANDVSYYKIEPVNEKQSGSELEILPKDLTKPEVLLTTAFMFLIFWG